MTLVIGGGRLQERFDSVWRRWDDQGDFPGFCSIRGS